MRSYHWFTEAVEGLTNDAREANSDKLLLGLSSAIDRFVDEANLSNEDRTKLLQIRNRAAAPTPSKGSEEIQTVEC